MLYRIARTKQIHTCARVGEKIKVGEPAYYRLVTGGALYYCEDHREFMPGEESVGSDGQEPAELHLDPNADDTEMRERRAARERFEMDSMFNNPKLYCVRCGREKTLQNLKYTRLYGYICVCGSDEWTGE